MHSAAGCGGAAQQGEGDHLYALWPWGKKRADPKGSSDKNGDFSILYFPPGEADHAAASKGIDPADQLYIKFELQK